MTDAPFLSCRLLNRPARVPCRTRGGFTVIELLLVVAIIAILSSLLFPVFARARDSARRGLCLSNVENIARAFRMYLADNSGVLPPSETREDVADFLHTFPDGGAGHYCMIVPDQVNPYLRYPVILDQYLWTRDVWQCPHARIQNGPALILPGPDWLRVLVDHQVQIGEDLCIRSNVFPPGWGGAVTDSFAQNRAPYIHLIYRAWGEHGSNATGVFVQSIGVNGTTRDLPVASVADPGNFIICGDLGPWAEEMSPGLLAYPDLCNAECANCACSDSWIEDCLSEVSAGCPEVAECFHRYHADSAMLATRTRVWGRAGARTRARIAPADPTLLSSYARHVGGTNIGFLDGHAEWSDSARFLDEWARQARAADMSLYAMGLEAWGPYSWCDGGDGPFSTGEEPTLR